jgi:hypothetical protein
MGIWEVLPIVSGSLLGFLISKYRRIGRWIAWSIGSAMLGGLAAFSSGEIAASVLFCLVDALIVAASSLATILTFCTCQAVTTHAQLGTLPRLYVRRRIVGHG